MNVAGRSHLLGEGVVCGSVDRGLGQAIAAALGRLEDVADLHDLVPVHGRSVERVLSRSGKPIVIGKTYRRDGRIGRLHLLDGVPDREDEQQTPKPRPGALGAPRACRCDSLSSFALQQLRVCEMWWACVDEVRRLSFF